jgi:hypothetical protein
VMRRWRWSFSSLQAAATRTLAIGVQAAGWRQAAGRGRRGGEKEGVGDALSAWTVRLGALLSLQRWIKAELKGTN